MLSSDNIGIKASRIRGSHLVTQSEGYNTLFSRAESEEGYRLYVALRVNVPLSVARLLLLWECRQRGWVAWAVYT